MKDSGPPSENKLPEQRVRCSWCLADLLYIAYHDIEWGVPLHSENGLFEFLLLETFQAGLSWLTILRKRENFRHAFAGFDPAAVAGFGEKDRSRLLSDAGIIRNRAKIDAAVNNARVFLKVQSDWNGFSRYWWHFTDGRPRINYWKGLPEVPAVTPLAVAISRDLKQRGFQFTGPTVVYAHMQATGMVNDHVTDCFRHAELAAAAG